MTMGNKDELEKDLEDAFIDWQLELKSGQQESVAYDHFDRSLEVLFVKRTDDFDRNNVKGLEENVRDIDGSFRVSTIRVPQL